MGHPEEGRGHVEDGSGELPGPAERVDEEKIPCDGDHGVIHHEGVLQVDGTVLDVIAGVQKELTITIEFKGLRWLVHFIRAFKVLSSTLSKFSLCSPNDLVEILNLTEASLRL